MPYSRPAQQPVHRPDVSVSEAIPTSPGKDECPDCWHHSHWKIDCPTCGCPDGITRKKARDAEHVVGHSDRNRPAEGFY